MSGIAISDLPTASFIGTTDIFPIVQGGVTKSIAYGLLGGIPSGGLLASTVGVTDLIPIVQNGLPRQGTAQLLGSSFTQTINTFTQSGTGAVATTVQTRLRQTISVFDFMTAAQIADVIARSRLVDVTTALQAAYDKANTEGYAVFHPAGSYKITAALTIYSKGHYYGVGGYTGSVLYQYTANTAIFTYATIEQPEIDHLVFTTNTVAGVTAIKQTDLTGYSVTPHIHHNDFYADLNTCISANLILSEIGPRNTFGYYGTAQTTHSHITSSGDTSNTTNINRIHANRFFNSKGAGSGVTFDRGYQLIVEDNDFESNSVCPLNCLGTGINLIRGNWFENNNFTSEITMANSSGGSPTTNLVNLVEGNWFHPHASITNLIQYSGAGAVTFQNNQGTAFSGKTVTNSADAFVSTYYNNALNGYGGTLVNKLDTTTLVNPSISVSSDADGDIWYRASGAVARLAKGAANTKLFMNAGATAPSWATGMKVGSFTRDLTAGAGNVAYTGVGFKPSAVILFAAGGNTTMGFDDGTNRFTLVGTTAAGDFTYDVSNALWFFQGAGTNQKVTVASFDSDGFTLAYTKAGSPTGTAGIGYLAFR
jgi:hypothetical protein